MKKVLLFEDFVSEATNVKDIAKKILGELDDNAQLFPDYVPAEALSAIEAALKKNKGLISKDAEKAAKQIRMNLEDIGILSNTFSPMDVEIMIMNHLNESVVESINPATFDKLVKDLAYSMPNHTKYDDEVGPSEEQIMAAMKKYQKDLYKYTNDAQKKEAVDKVLQILTESVNEAKELDRDTMMAMMSDKYKIKHVRTTEEFDGQTGGIWMAADNGETLSAGKIFDYYNNSAKYKGGVLKNVVAAAEKAGWWFSWNDPGTIMLWPKN